MNATTKSAYSFSGAPPLDKECEARQMQSIWSNGGKPSAKTNVECASMCPKSHFARQVAKGENGSGCEANKIYIKISVVNAPSSEFLDKYPLYFSTIASTLIKPSPRPLPLLLAKIPPSFDCFFCAVKLVKEM